MDHPARRLRFRLMAVFVPVVFVVFRPIVVGSIVLMLFWFHTASSFLGKLLLRREMCSPMALGGCERCNRPYLVMLRPGPHWTRTQEIFFRRRCRPVQESEHYQLGAGRSKEFKGSDGSRRIPRGPAPESCHPG